MVAVQGTQAQPLTAVQRAELANLRKQVVDLEKDMAFLGGRDGVLCAGCTKGSDSR